MKNPYKQHRNRFQAEAYKQHLEERLRAYRRHMTEAMANIQHCLDELNSPENHHYYCDDCGRGFDSAEGAHYCCNEHP